MFYIQSKSLHFNLNRWCSSTTSSTNLRCEVISKNQYPIPMLGDFLFPTYKASGPPTSSYLLSLNFQTLLLSLCLLTTWDMLVIPFNTMLCPTTAPDACCPQGIVRIQTTDFTQPLPASHHSWDGSELLKFLPCSQLHDWHPHLVISWELESGCYFILFLNFHLCFLAA